MLIETTFCGWVLFNLTTGQVGDELLIIQYTFWLSDQTDFDFYKGVEGSRTTEKLHCINDRRYWICEHNLNWDISHLISTIPGRFHMCLLLTSQQALYIQVFVERLLISHLHVRDKQAEVRLGIRGIRLPLLVTVFAPSVGDMFSVRWPNVHRLTFGRCSVDHMIPT